MPYEIIGYDDGYDDVDEVLSGYDIVGADKRAMRGNPFAQWSNRPRSPQAVIRAAPLAGRSVGSAVRPQTPTKSRRIMLPFESTGTVAAGATATITARPQDVAFKGERLVIPSTIAPDFVLTDIKIGNKSQPSAAGNIPGECFLPNSVDTMLDLDTAQTAQDVILVVQNISGAARTFRGVLFGHAIQV